MFIQGDQKNRGRWNIGIFMKLTRGRDGVVQSARIKCGKSMLEKAIRHLHPLNLSYNRATETEKDPPSLNVNALEYLPERTAAVVVKLQINFNLRSISVILLV